MIIVETMELRGNSKIHTPQQNGVTKRMNRTLMGMEISMMYFKGLSTKYWAEVVHIAVYLIN